MPEKPETDNAGGCPECGNSEVKLTGTAGYYDFWFCEKCRYDFKRHVMWKAGEAQALGDNVVKLVTPLPKKEPRKPLSFRVGPSTIQPDITPYESAMLVMLIIRVAGDEVLYPEDLSAYPQSMLRHLVIKP